MASGDGKLLVDFLQNAVHALVAEPGQRKVAQHLRKRPKLVDDIIAAQPSGLLHNGKINHKIAVKGSRLDVFQDLLEVPNALALCGAFSRVRGADPGQFVQCHHQAFQIALLGELGQPQVVGIEKPQFDFQHAKRQGIPKDERIVRGRVLERLLDQIQPGFGTSGGGLKALNQLGAPSESREFHQPSSGVIEFGGGHGRLAKLRRLAEDGGLRGVLFLIADLGEQFFDCRAQGRENRQGVLELPKFFELIGVRDCGHGRRSG